MRSGPRRTGRIARIAIALLITTAAGAAADSGLEKARDLAETFAKAKSSQAGVTRTIEPVEAPSPADEQRLVEEIDMLERARAEAEARREALVREREAAERTDQAAGSDAAAKAEAKRKTDEIDRRIAAEREKASQATRQAEEAKRKVEEIEKRFADERERVERAVREAAEARQKVEAAERRLAEERARTETALREAEALRRAEEERRLAAERERATVALREAEARQQALEDAEAKRMAAEREAEARRIDEALRQAREARAARSASGPGAATIETAASDPGRATDPPAERGGRQVPTGWSREEADVRDRAAPPRRDEHAASRHATRVAVLMVMVPGNRGIRRSNKSADPILCGERGCYVSTGVDAAADLLPMRRAFGAGRTLGARAGACSNSLGCIFRDVDLVAYPAIVQPIDMRFLRHDRRQPQVLHEASDCRLEARRLSCSPIEGPDYRMWVVPEEMAAAAGAETLERALASGLE